MKRGKGQKRQRRSAINEVLCPPIEVPTTNENTGLERRCHASRKSANSIICVTHRCSNSSTRCRHRPNRQCERGYTVAAAKNRVCCQTLLVADLRGFPIIFPSTISMGEVRIEKQSKRVACQCQGRHIAPNYLHTITLHDSNQAEKSGKCKKRLINLIHLQSGSFEWKKKMGIDQAVHLRNIPTLSCCAKVEEKRQKTMGRDEAQVAVSNFEYFYLHCHGLLLCVRHVSYDLDTTRRKGMIGMTLGGNSEARNAE
mmetsp:Transcript_37956/g.97966  ORF Transcript_37956/g.97966 Transcript_37956/m.97966 type:complete len:255 (+) Transcript_37956:510-1274(+)